MATRKVIGMAGSLASVPIIHYKVMAEDCCGCEHKKLMKPNELPIYGNPNKRIVELVDDEPNRYTSIVTTTREQTWKVMDSLQDTRTMLMDKYGVAKAHTLDLVTYIQSDPGSIPRAAVITVAGLGGIVAGYKRGILRKGLYAALSMTAAGALCYPNQAADISDQAFREVKTRVTDMWEQNVSKSKKVAPQSTEKSAPEDEKPVDDSMVDMGQSKPEDKDMYSTRS